MIYTKLKEILLILGGVLLGIFFITPNEQFLQSHYWGILYTAVVFLMIGIGLLDWLLSIVIFLTRLVNKNIGFYEPYSLSKENSSWINLSTSEICMSLKKNGIPLIKFKYEILFNCFNTIINPYGGVYPEIDISNLSSFHKIFSYVRKGGIYINISDIPFYYAFEKNLSRRVDTTPFSGDLLNIRTFRQCLVSKKLHTTVYALNDKKNITKGILRVMSLGSNSLNLYDGVISITDEEQDFSPCLAIPYGKGYFVFSTSPIKTAKDADLVSEVIKKARAL